MSNYLLLKVEGDPYIVDSKPQELNRCGAWLEWVEDHDLQNAMLSANINVLRREAPYVYFFACNETLEGWNSSWFVRNQPYVQSFAATQLQRCVWPNNPGLDFETTTVVAAVLLGDVLPLARALEDCENCIVCLPEPITLEEMDALFVREDEADNNLKLLLSGGGFVLAIIDLKSLEVRTSNKRVLEYFAP